MTGAERLGREGRLTRTDAIRQVFRSGRRQRLRYVDMVWTVNQAGHPRLGIVVPKFQSTAVARNRLRRRLKEIWRRRITAAVPDVDVIVRARPEAYGAAFPELEADLMSWARRQRRRSE